MLSTGCQLFFRGLLRQLMEVKLVGPLNALLGIHSSPVGLMVIT
eukprot:COSAG02_NODE_624_length_19387_cov_90.736002_13_plen_44_part_00